MHLHDPGEWSVLDDKYRTFAAKEYLHALSLRMHKSRRRWSMKGRSASPIHGLFLLPNETFATYKKEKFMKCYEIDLRTLFRQGRGQKAFQKLLMTGSILGGQKTIGRK